MVETCRDVIGPPACIDIGWTALYWDSERVTSFSGILQGGRGTLSHSSSPSPTRVASFFWSAAAEAKVWTASLDKLATVSAHPVSSGLLLRLPAYW